MRIIAGTRRGKRLTTLDGEDTRPTLERMKQALFSAIQFELADRYVLDLFAGSGQLGLEALSRGAKKCWFNDASPAAMKVVHRNISDCGFEKNAKETCIDYRMCVKMIEREQNRPNLVFLDPPYAKGLAADALEHLAPLLPDGALVAVETGSGEEVPLCGLSLRKEYRQGTVKITLLEKESV
ncbi:MAG: 16S rRNA (guanine(966)-N(2))-methyltransferase RsmD [Clostridia bacterium]|nr:16S rRNA (guanine(966)-N(2))-methyltransferase RsmD [Clostridia bacterium]